MKALNVFNYVVWFAFFVASCFVAFGSAGARFMEPSVTALAAVAILFAWTAISVACVLFPLLNAEPKSLSTQDVEPYMNAFAMPATAAFLLGAAFCWKYWGHFTLPMIIALASLLFVAYALIFAGAGIQDRLAKKEPEESTAATTA